jgi:hypothetical protein
VNLENFWEKLQKKKYLFNNGTKLLTTNMSTAKLQTRHNQNSGNEFVVSEPRSMSTPIKTKMLKSSPTMKPYHALYRMCE